MRACGGARSGARGDDLARGARAHRGGDDDGADPGRRHRAERRAHGAGQAQPARAAARRADRARTRRRGGRAGGRVRTRGRDRSAHRPHALPRHDLGSRQGGRGDARGRGAKPRAPRVSRHRAAGRPRRLPGEPGADRGALQPQPGRTRRRPADRAGRVLPRGAGRFRRLAEGARPRRGRDRRARRLARHLARARARSGAGAARPARPLAAAGRARRRARRSESRRRRAGRGRGRDDRARIGRGDPLARGCALTPAGSPARRRATIAARRLPTVAMSRSRPFSRPALAGALALAAIGLVRVEVRSAPAPVDVYAGAGAGMLSAAVAGDLERVYVPDLRSDDVTVIDPRTMKVVDRFKVGRSPQHIVPAWNLRTLWVTNNAEGRTDGSLTPIDPRTGKPGSAVAVDDPYNMYFTPDGRSAIVVAEARKRLDFRDPRTMALQYSIEVPGCPGINHADFSADGRSAIFTCEFSGALAKIDLAARQVAGYLQLSMPARRFKELKVAQQRTPGKVWEPDQTEVCSATKGMPQDIRISPDGQRFYVADMIADGVHVIDAASFRQVGFIATGLGTHGLYPSRDGKRLYIVNRGTHEIHGVRRGDGGVTVMDFASEKIVARWGIPGGGSPDMGNVSADGRWLWLSGRYDDVAYRFDTATGEVRSVKVGAEPHGLSVLPLVVGVALALGLGWLYWESAVAAVRASLEQWQLVDAALRWVETVVGASFRDRKSTRLNSSHHSIS